MHEIVYFFFLNVKKLSKLWENTYRMNRCCLRLQSEAGPEICGGRQTLKAEFKFIEKFIESIFGTGLQTEKGVY